jgi:hypothetical protein
MAWQALYSLLEPHRTAGKLLFLTGALPDLPHAAEPLIAAEALAMRRGALGILQGYCTDSAERGRGAVVFIGRTRRT